MFASARARFTAFSPGEIGILREVEFMVNNKILVLNVVVVEKVMSIGRPNEDDRFRVVKTE
jgi:hypothetical protein